MTDTLNSIHNQVFTTKPEYQSSGEISLTIIHPVTCTLLAQGMGSNHPFFLFLFPFHLPTQLLFLTVKRLRHMIPAFLLLTGCGSKATGSFRTCILDSYLRVALNLERAVGSLMGHTGGKVGFLASLLGI